jgi:hypothetical protein
MVELLVNRMVDDLTVGPVRTGPFAEEDGNLRVDAYLPEPMLEGALVGVLLVVESDGDHRASELRDGREQLYRSKRLWLAAGLGHATCGDDTVGGSRLGNDVLNAFSGENGDARPMVCPAGKNLDSLSWYLSVDRLKGFANRSLHLLDEERRERFVPFADEQRRHRDDAGCPGESLIISAR